MDSLLQTIFFICLEKLELRLKSILFSDFAFCSKIVSKNSNIMSLVDELTIGPMRNWCYTIWLYHSRNVPRANNNFGLIFLNGLVYIWKKIFKKLYSVKCWFLFSLVLVTAKDFFIQGPMKIVVENLLFWLRGCRKVQIFWWFSSQVWIF